MEKRRGLGRGLDALFQDVKTDDTAFTTKAMRADEIVAVASTQAPSSPNAPRKISINKLEPGKYQPRRNFSEEALQSLADSIKVHGVLQPLLVRPTSNGKYEIIAGERRWRAAQIAQVHELPVVSLDFTDKEAAEISLIENLQREDLSPIEEAMGYQRLIEEFTYTQDDLAKQLSKSRSQIANTLRLLKLPEIVKNYLDKGEISAGHARALVGCEQAVDIAKAIVKRGLSVRQTEKMVKDCSECGEVKTQGRKKAPKFIEKDVDVMALEEKMTSLLGMKFIIDAKGDEGVVSIEYKTLEQLDDILERLSNYKISNN